MTGFSLVASRFTHLWVVPLAIALAMLVAFLGWRTEQRRRRRLAQLGDVPVLERLLPHTEGTRVSHVRAIVLGLATLGLGLAIAGPHWGERSEQRRDAGIDLGLVLDVSASMLAADDGISRLEQMKADVRRLIATMPAVRVALVVVAGRSYVLTPLTSDQDALALFLDGLDPSMVSQGGTALAAGITQATQLLGKAPDAGDRAVVIMSDGETWDDEGEIAASVQEARKAGLSIVTVGYGTTAGANIPVAGGGVKRDRDGTPVVTRANPGTLDGIARAGDGVFVDGKSADRPGRVRAALRRLRQTERTYSAGSSPVQRYQLFLWPAFLLLLIEALWSGGALRKVRPSAAAAVTALLLVLSSTAAAQRPASPSRDPLTLYKERRFVEAAAAFRARMRDGDRSVRTLYNLGTALMESDSTAAATEVLNRVITLSPDPELRYRALFNAGLASLRRARAEKGPSAEPYFAAAVASYKRALRTRTDDPDAKWNLELALRDQQRNSGGGGGGAGGQEPPPPTPPPSSGQQQLEKQRAAAVLGSAARDERDVQARRVRDGARREAPNGRDW